MDAKTMNEMMASKAPSGALSIIARLQEAGYDSYLVGGCVRDALLGKYPHDWDITTSATPEEMKKALGDLRSFDTGIEHGTVTFIGSDGESYEVTAFRRDGEYSDGRHPDAVEFSDSVEEDLARRDFTVNAMAWNPDAGLVDPFGGKEDLATGVLRGVGDPEERFREDGLRIMRAVRFAAVLGLEIEENTSEAMRSQIDMLDSVSVERTTTELMKLLAANDADHMVDTLIENKDVLFKVMPELAVEDGFDQNNPNHDRDLFVHTMDTLRYLESDDPVLRFSALVHDIGKPASEEVGDDGVSHYYGHMAEGAAIVDSVCRRMKFGNDERERVISFVKDHDLRPRATRKSVRRFLARCGSDDMARDMLKLMRADINAHSPQAIERANEYFEGAVALVEVELAERMEFCVKDLCLNGHDLIDMGYVPGPSLGAALKEMFMRVVDGDVENEKSVLSDMARSILDGTYVGVEKDEETKTYEKHDAHPYDGNHVPVSAQHYRS